MNAKEEACCFVSYRNGDYSYKENGATHLIRDYAEIATGDDVYSFGNGDYEYKVNGELYFFNRKGEKLN